MPNISIDPPGNLLFVDYQLDIRLGSAKYDQHYDMIISV